MFEADLACFLENLLNRYASRVHHSKQDTNSKYIQWKHSSSPKKSKIVSFAGKVMTSDLKMKKAITLLTKFKRTTISIDRQLRKADMTKFPRKQTNVCLSFFLLSFLHADYSPALKSLVSMAALIDYELADYPHYSPDLAQSDNNLSHNMKKKLCMKPLS